VSNSADGSLEGVIAARTSLAHVDGRRGVAIVRGYSLADLARHRTYEDCAHLVLHGELPTNDSDRRAFSAALAAGALLTDAEERIARQLGDALPKPEALAAALPLADDAASRASDPIARAVRLLGRVPSVCAAVTGVPIPPPAWPYAHRALAALGSPREDVASRRAFEVLLSLESEHGLSASTFACRVAASSGAGAGVSLAAGAATLSGPRHGGATALALDLLGRAAARNDSAALVQEAFRNGERLPGFGHRIYKVADPRVAPMRDAASLMVDRGLIDVAESLRIAAEPVFGPKGVHANIDLYGAALLAALGVAREQFVAAFAVGIACGWLAHWVEQSRTGRLIRPDSTYDGPAERAVPIPA